MIQWIFEENSRNSSIRDIRVDKCTVENFLELAQGISRA